MSCAVRKSLHPGAAVLMDEWPPHAPRQPGCLVMSTEACSRPYAESPKYGPSYSARIQRAMVNDRNGPWIEFKQVKDAKISVM